MCKNLIAIATIVTIVILLIGASVCAQPPTCGESRQLGKVEQTGRGTIYLDDLSGIPMIEAKIIDSTGNITMAASDNDSIVVIYGRIKNDGRIVVINSARQNELMASFRKTRPLSWDDVAGRVDFYCQPAGKEKTSQTSVTNCDRVEVLRGDFLCGTYDSTTDTRIDTIFTNDKIPAHVQIQYLNSYKYSDLDSSGVIRRVNFGRSNDSTRMFIYGENKDGSKTVFMIKFDGGGIIDFQDPKIKNMIEIARDSTRIGRLRNALLALKEECNDIKK